jgi:hypothetical protein
MSEQTKMAAITVASNKADREEQSKEKKAADEALQSQFATLNFEDIRNKSDKDLAVWQAQYPVDSPQFIFALQVWNNRTISKQTKWMKFSAILAAISTITGVFIGAILQEYRESNRKAGSIEVICKTPFVPSVSNTVNHQIKTENNK